jgi:3D (Asp-Asp-Asp) domain-containing protein
VIARILPLLLTAAVSWAQEGWLLVEATAYCPCALCCDVRTERTANGTDTNKVPYGLAASRNIPLGARIYVPSGAGYLDRMASRSDDRWFFCDDRGGALDAEHRRGGVTRLDLRVRDHSYAKQFGRKLIMVYIMPGDK